MIGEKAKIFLDCLSWEWVQSSSQFLLSLGLGKVGGWAVFFSFFSFFFFFLFPVNSVLGCFFPPLSGEKIIPRKPSLCRSAEIHVCSPNMYVHRFMQSTWEVYNITIL